jgi:hypothetical protein
MKKRIISRAIFCALAALGAGPAFAGPADYVFVPSVDYGEKEVDFKLGTKNDVNDERTSAASLGFGYGATRYWFTELYVKYNRDEGNGTRFDAIEWENKFQLTEPGKFPVDLGLITEIERPRDRSEGWEFKFGPLLQTEFGKTQLNANLLFERHYRGESPSEMEMGYQLQAKYRWKPEFEFGVQALGDMGKWNDWAPRSEQSHRFGPAIFGKLALGNHQAIKYNAALLFDTNRATRSNTFRTQVEYEF